MQPSSSRPPAEDLRTARDSYAALTLMGRACDRRYRPWGPKGEREGRQKPPHRFRNPARKTLGVLFVSLYLKFLFLSELLALSSGPSVLLSQSPFLLL